MAKEEKIEVEGTVIEILKGGDCLVQLDGIGSSEDRGPVIKGYIGGKMKMNMIRIFKGDRVVVEMSPYDLTRGRITWNKR